MDSVTRERVLAPDKIADSSKKSAPNVAPEIYGKRRQVRDVSEGVVSGG